MLVPIAPPSFDVDIDLRYATPDNLAGVVIYRKPVCLLAPEAARALARAADLGVAMQLSNIARDVGTDAAMGRIYLPLAWLREAGIHPEAFLAREAQMAYATVGLVTDYDCWLEDPSQHVNVASIFELYGSTLKKAAKVLDALLSQALPEPEAAIRSALGSAMLTPDTALTEEQKLWLDVLRR